MRMLVCDIETNRLHNPDKIWVVVTFDIKTKELGIYTDEPIETNLLRIPSGVNIFNVWNLSGLLNIKSCTWIGHNFLSFDGPILNRLLDRKVVKFNKIIDTLIVSRMKHYNIEGGHGLDAWGKRLGEKKLEFTEFDKFSMDMVNYCIQDVLTNYKLYLYLSNYIKRYSKSIKLQHNAQYICNDISLNGFYFDIDSCLRLKEREENKLKELDDRILSSFSSIPKPLKEIKPRVTQKGELSKVNLKAWDEDKFDQLEADCPFTLLKWEEFNLGSPKQIVDRLNKAGWKPKDKTKGHILAERKLRRGEETSKTLEYYQEFGWKVNEENLNTLPSSAPEEAKLIKERIMVNSRLTKFKEWIEVYNPETHRIHGTLNAIGSWTHRASHTAPNMANIPALDSYLGKEMRALHGVPRASESISPKSIEEGVQTRLIGCDADGIQLRIFAHYAEDADLIKATVSGRKEDGTDQHTMNMKALGKVCNSRDVAKTFIYCIG